MKLKRIAALALGMSMVLALAACGGGTTADGGSSAPAQTEAQGSGSGDTVELNLWSFNIGGFTDSAAWEPLVAAFNEANPNINVVVTPINYQDGD